jgi:carboxyl-terminal processing protease
VTLPPPLKYEVRSCDDTPPVAFALLCEAFDLIVENHVDQPLDVQELAVSARIGVTSAPDGTETEAPRVLVCALPEVAMEPVCAAIAERLRFGEISVEEAVEAAVRSMIELSLDPFTLYLPPALSGELREDGIIGGIGVLLDATDAAGSRCRFVGPSCPLRVVFVVEGGPGDAAGLEPGDVIETIGDESVEGKALLDVVAAITEGSTVRVGVRRDDEATMVTLMPGSVEFPTVDGRMISPGVGYLLIPDFGFDTAALVIEALVELRADGASTLVIDLRDNPGGLLLSVILVASQFVPDGEILSTTGPGDEVESHEAFPGGIATGVRTIVLINGGSASAAEVLAGTLRDRARGVLVGSPSFGKNTVQIPFRLRNDGELRVTVARWLTPSGESVAPTGLAPDIAFDFPQNVSVEELVSLVLAETT